MYPDRQTPPNTRNQSYLRRKGVVNHVPGLKRKGCPGTLKPLRVRRGRRAAACMERYYTGPFEGPPIIKPPAAGGYLLRWTRLLVARIHERAPAAL